MLLKSFGCSFIFGTDLPDNNKDGLYPVPSQLTWPALTAKKLNLEYSCYARAGSGNLRILETVLTHAATNEQDLFVIGWTWIDRFDYTNTVDQWQTILPVDKTSEADFYYRNLHSQYRDKLSTLIYIQTAINVLQQKRIPFIMTYMDELIFETEWHSTPAITDIQTQIRPCLSSFQGKTFLDWSRDNKYPISQTLHPLEKAHESAADLMLNLIRNKIDYTSQQKH